MAAEIEHIAVLGAGAWGTALAIAAHRAGRKVTLCARRNEQAATIAATRVNERYLPGCRIDPAIAVTSDPAIVAEADAVLLALPAQHLRATLEQIAAHWGNAAAVICAKGIERGSGLLMPEIVAELLPDRALAMLSGPTFAAEVARDLPTAVTLAGRDAGMVEALMAALGTRRFRPYASDDPIGAAVGGATKNVLAIGCGIIAGRGLGENARAAIVSRALVELQLLARAKGGRPETTMGLSGLGDLLLTCTSPQSRNYSLGAELGAGRSLDAILAERRTVAEGVETAAALGALARERGLDMPIGFAVEAVLHGGASIEAAIETLLGRPLRAELAGGAALAGGSGNRPAKG
ncbi:MAG: NAD(P)H-dependent glycerol-3-phosphate dehydrogenase [Dongiaceae bacterium]